MAISLSSIKKGREKKPPRILIFGTDGVGKALRNDMPVLLKDGSWKPIGEMEVGDLVATPDGGSAPVLGVFPQGEREVCELKVKDGGSVICDWDHLWVTETAQERGNSRTLQSAGIFRGRVRTTRQILDTLKTRVGSINEASRHYIPTPSPLAGHSLDLPVEPYALGALLGNGSMTEGNSVTYCGMDEDVVERISQSINIGAVFEKPESLAKSYILLDARDKMRELNLYGADSSRKFIPDIYLSANAEARLALFQGLMDTDGHPCSTGGVVEYCTVSERLATGIEYLARSLGCTSATNTKIPTYTHRGQKRYGQKAYRIHIKIPASLSPFYCSRKALSFRNRDTYGVFRQIESIEPAGVAECTCIYIGHPEHLYITKDFLVTHNSSWAAGAPSPIFTQTEDRISHIEADKFPLCESFTSACETLKTLISEEHNYQTHVTDSADWLEKLAHKELCEEHGETAITSNAKGSAFGYGRG